MRHSYDQRDLLYEGDGITMWLREYFVGITAAALICGIVRVLVPPKGAVGTVMKTLLALAMVFAVVSPWTSLSTSDLYLWKEDISLDAQSVVSGAENSAKEEVRRRIMEQTRSYILAKAATLGAQVEVSVEVTEESMAVPSSVKISGAVSPYAKQVLSQMLTDDLGLDREEQEWIS